MAGAYTIAGKQIAGHYLAIGWLSTLFGGIYYATSGPKTAAVNNAPPINASSSDEADFIKKFMAQAEKDEKK